MRIRVQFVLTWMLLDRAPAHDVSNTSGVFGMFGNKQDIQLIDCWLVDCAWNILLLRSCFQPEVPFSQLLTPSMLLRCVPLHSKHSILVLQLSPWNHQYCSRQGYPELLHLPQFQLRHSLSAVDVVASQEERNSRYPKTKHSEMLS